MSLDEASPAVVLEHVSVHRGPTLALNDISCEVDGGHVTGLIGPSGSGKTTFMRAVVGVQANVAGSVRVLGRAAGHPTIRRQIGYVSQDTAVYADLTVVENLAYFARLLGCPRARLEQVLGAAHLWDQRNQIVATLSGGQRARVSLGIALLAEPALLVLDEPTVGLDPVLRNELWGEFARLAANGTTLVVSSHVMDEAERCEQLMLLRDGSLLDTGSPAELLERTGASRIEDAFLALVGRR